MKVLIFLHRWMGIPMCVFFAVWFASGIVMMYVEMPELSESQRLAALPALDRRAKLSAAAAIDAAEVKGISSIKLTSLFGRPVWRLRDQEGAWLTVFADTGDVRDTFQYEEAAASATPFLAAGSRPRLIAALDGPDQWTVGGTYRGLRPLYRVALDDPAGTELYIASTTGEVVLRSTSRTRMLAWAGAIPHWIYFTSIRKHGALWRQLILWLSGIGCVVALLGLTIGIRRFSLYRRYFVQGGDRRRSPYAGMMRWHHWGGLIFGVVTFTWVFSGMLSMEPGWYTSTGSVPAPAQAEAFSGGPLDPHVYGASPAMLLAGRPSVKELQIRQVAGRPYYSITGPDRKTELIDDAGHAVAPFGDDFLTAAAQRAVPQGRIVEQVVLQDYDAYYYDRDENLPLPVLRVKFDDPQKSWLYIDPRRGGIVERYEKSGRVERWLYHGLHSLDFPFLWRARPAWDIVVIALCLGGFLLSITAIVIGYRRLRPTITSGVR